MRIQPTSPRFSSATWLAALPVALVAMLLASGCRAHRTLEIRTTPPGAEIVLDQEVLGLSPVKIEFYHYGDRRITASLPTYHTYSERVEIVPPWYARFPMDLVSEVFLPIGWTDHHVIDIELVAGSDEIQAPDFLSVLERAEVLRRAGPEGVKELPKVRVISIGRQNESETPDP